MSLAQAHLAGALAGGLMKKTLTLQDLINKARIWGIAPAEIELRMADCLAVTSADLLDKTIYLGDAQ